MLSEQKIRKIKEYEQASIDIVAIDNGEFCDQCSAFRLLPDPDPFDWFRDGDMKAVCLEVNGVIEGSLEVPSEWTNICKPLYCPKLEGELTEEEKEKATRQLKWAKELMK